MPSLVEAHKLLLKEALVDPRNTMFVLVSEACIPLYHPALFWAQLMSESHVSRIARARHTLLRWSPVMETDWLKDGHFQKSQQWSSLTRMHALLVLEDQHVWAQFKRYCITQV
jgi:hypothetical protein